MATLHIIGHTQVAAIGAAELHTTVTAVSWPAKRFAWLSIIRRWLDRLQGINGPQLEIRSRFLWMGATIFDKTETKPCGEPVVREMTSCYPVCECALQYAAGIRKFSRN